MTIIGTWDTVKTNLNRNEHPAAAAFAVSQHDFCSVVGCLFGVRLKMQKLARLPFTEAEKAFNKADDVLWKAEKIYKDRKQAFDKVEKPFYEAKNDLAVAIKIYNETALALMKENETLKDRIPKDKWWEWGLE